MKPHHPDCDWHLDQYDFECTCGAARPKADWFDAHALRATITRAEAYLTSKGLVADNLRPKPAAAQHSGTCECADCWQAMEGYAR